jgi:hypothetical protein
MDFVVFSDDWGGHPSSCQHIFRHVAHDHRVLWVNTVGMRAPRLTGADLRKAAAKLGRMLKPRQRVPATASAGVAPVVISPFMLPFPDSTLARQWNARFGLRVVRRAMQALGMHRPVVVATTPNACDIVGKLGAASVIYYCVDDFAQWPGLSSEPVRDMENRLIAASDRIAASSPVLYERLRGRRPAMMLPHGADVELFSSEPGVEHAALAAIPRPRAGYYGLLDDRMDEQLVAGLADAMPDWSFVFAGPQESALTMLKSRRNVHLIGPVAYADLPSFTTGLDALLLPYRVDGFTHTLSPLKLREYVLSGKPVICAPLQGVEEFAGLISLACSQQEWEPRLRAAIGADIGGRRRRARALLQGDSWSNRAGMLLDFAAAPVS